MWASRYSDVLVAFFDLILMLCCLQVIHLNIEFRLPVVGDIGTLLQDLLNKLQDRGLADTRHFIYTRFDWGSVGGEGKEK